MTVETHAAASPAIDPRRYHDSVADARTAVAMHDPVCLYLETTNRCNLLCTTCPRTYADLEPEADMSWELFTRIVDQVPNIARVVLHGVGEPMLVKELPRMIRYLKARGAYVLFNTNGTVLTAKKGRELADTGLDELRVSLDAADAATFRLVRGKDYFNRIVRNVKAFTEMQAREGLERPARVAVADGLEGDRRPARRLRAHRPRHRRARGLPAAAGVLRRGGRGHGAAGSGAVRAAGRGGGAASARGGGAGRAELGISFNASGATEPGESLARKAETSPWSLCRRPWSVMYFTANGRALPCCIAPFAQKGYENYTLGDATQATLREIWNGPAYQGFRDALQSDAPPKSCANCGLRWSL